MAQEKCFTCSQTVLYQITPTVSLTEQTPTTTETEQTPLPSTIIVTSPTAPVKGNKQPPQTNPIQTQYLSKVGMGDKPKSKEVPKVGIGDKPKTEEVPEVGTGDKPKTKEVPKVGEGEKPKTQELSNVGMGDKPKTNEVPRVKKPGDCKRILPAITNENDFEKYIGPNASHARIPTKKCKI